MTSNCAGNEELSQMGKEGGASRNRPVITPGHSNQHSGSQEKRMPPRSALLLLANASLIVAVGLLAFCVKFFVQPVQRGFYCGDLTIRYPYKDSTVPIGNLLLVANTLVITAIVLAEFIRKQKRFDSVNELYQIFERVIDPCYSRAIQFFLASLLGFVINLWLVYLVKFNIGQLRPHFLDVCQPNVNYANCTYLEYFEKYSCTTDGIESAAKLKDAHLSFFSGHTSAAFYYASFLVIYIHSRIGQFEFAWIPLFCLTYTFLFASAGLVGISRILDNKHHTADVVAGALIGTIVAAVVLYCYKHLFESNQPKRSHDQITFESETKGKKLSAVSTQNSNV